MSEVIRRRGLPGTIIFAVSIGVAGASATLLSVVVAVSHALIVGPILAMPREGSSAFEADEVAFECAAAAPRVVVLLLAGCASGVAPRGSSMLPARGPDGGWRDEGRGGEEDSGPSMVVYRRRRDGRRMALQ